MPWWRAFVVDDKTNENRGERDVEADDEGAARVAAEKLLEKGERIVQLVGIVP